MKRPIFGQQGRKAGLFAATAIIVVASSPANAQIIESVNAANDTIPQDVVIVDQSAFEVDTNKVSSPLYNVEIEAVETSEEEDENSFSLTPAQNDVDEDIARLAAISAPVLQPLSDANGYSTSDEERVIVTMAGSLNPFAGSLDPFAGSLDPFGGTLDPFGGSLDPFAGSIDPFAGSLDPFGGDVNPFHGEVRLLWASVDPFKGGINNTSGPNPFWGDANPHLGEIDSQTGIRLPSYVQISNFWSSFGSDWRLLNIRLNRIQQLGATSSDNWYADYLINRLVSQSNTRWGAAIEARTGQTFEQAFVDPLFARFGIGSDRRAGFLALSFGQRAQLVTEWFDGLNTYTGHNQLDHWMRTVNWNPELTRLQGSGADAVIGILDSSIAGGSEFTGNVFHSGGYAASVGGHGVGVASLLIGSHDGEGVMGIAPNASVATYNPFDASGTASWTDIRNGIISLKNAGASVINMSLGVSGWTFHSEWHNVFSNGQVKKVAKDTVFVIAAGNDGITQTQDVEWKRNLDFGFIIVGAIDPTGNISSISNRPGSTCLLENGQCNGNYLRNHFIVAPGELLLVSDGHGGVTRRSGTSFAAPLVSGAITLLHDRWPWLANDPQATVDIILGSAQDLGAPGIDDIYGVGLLDVEASQSPLSFDDLKIYEYKAGKKKERKSKDLRNGGVGSTWEVDGVFLSLFEEVGSSKRDFLVPFSSQLIGQKSSVNGSDEYFQSYLRKRFVDWSNGNQGGFTDVSSFTSAGRNGLNITYYSATNPAAQLNDGNYSQQLPYAAVKVSNEEQGFQLHSGYGLGSMALVGQGDFGLLSDYDPQRGGINPVLGLASGGAFLDAELRIAKNTSVAFGITDRRLQHSLNPELSAGERLQLRNAKDYEASAFNLRLTHKPMENVNLSLSFASLQEKDGLLGVQSSLEGTLRNGSSSKTITFGASFDLPEGINLSASATAALTKTGNSEDQSLLSRGNIRSSAYAVSFAKQGLLGKNDNLRLSFTQPLHVEKGVLEFNSIEVIDRATGEIGDVKRSFSIGDTSRRFTGEFLYATPISKGAEFSLFGRAEYGSKVNSDVNEIIAGGMLTVSF